jgi:hydrogenase maturation protease
MLHIVCFGNYWQGDDGFGVHVFRRLGETCGLPPHVKVFDAGTAGLSALDYFENCGKVVIVDAIKTGGPIGRVQRLRLEDLDLPDQEFSIHSFGVEHLLGALPVLFEGRMMPEVVVIGAEVGAITPFTDTLTPPLQSALEQLVSLVRSECMNWVS